MSRDADVVTRDPLNVETSWNGLASPITPTSEFYTRNNHAIPELPPDEWRLKLTGFAKPAEMTLTELRALPARTLDVVLECAGNGRTFFEPRPEGTAWGERAAGCGRFTGARLRDVLARAGVPDGTREIAFLGGDTGGKHRFERSLPLATALDDDTLVVWEMNGAPLAPQHGAPVRLVVPSWYAVASVKWLVEARALREPFRGHFQTERYVYQQSADDPDPRPVRQKHVNSLVVTPAPGQTARAGDALLMRGWAWSGHAPIARVEVSLDGGASWKDAALDAEPGRHAWRGWSLHARMGDHDAVVLSRAHDEAGNAQPARAAWNVHGYAYDAPRPRLVRLA